MKIILSLLQIAFAALIVAPLGALIQCFALAKLWAWFDAAQYGAGPSYASWYGISLIGSVVMTLTIVSSRVTTNDDKRSFSAALASAIGAWIGLFIVLIVAFIIGSVTGWIA